MTIIPPGETIAETKTCLISGEEFHVTDKDLEFYDKVSPIFNGKKYTIPSPTLCPDERMRRRYMFRNENKIYIGRCGLTNKKILSTYSPESQIIAYSPEAFFSDAWSGVENGVDICFDSSFMSQFHQLKNKSPHISTYSVSNENCEFVNNCAYSKNLYMCFGVGMSEDTLHSNSSYHLVNSTDIYLSDDCQYSCGIFGSKRMRRSFYCSGSRDCTDSYYLVDCSNCSDCILCSGLHGKRFYINNVMYTESEYHRKKKEFLKVLHSSKSTLDAEYVRLQQRNIKCATRNEKVENSFGDYLVNTNNLTSSFYTNDSSDSKFLCECGQTSKCMDICHGNTHLEYSLDCYQVGSQASNMLFCSSIYEGSSNILYGFLMTGSRNCFGCCSLKKASHCILNKSYGKHEYEVLCGKVIDHMKSSGEWGEFFPHKMSPFGYNETIAQEYFPMTEEVVLDKGWKWHHEKEKDYEGVVYKPLNIEKYDEAKVGKEEAKKNIYECLKGILICDVTKKPFRIIKQELVFYIQHSLPLPTCHPNQRHKERFVQKNDWKLYERTCMCPTCKSPNEPMYTTYAPDRPETVYCEECYREEVYS